MVKVSEFADVPLHYDRTSPAEYGTRGRPATFQCGAGFKKKLDACFKELWTVKATAEVITTAGLYVEKSGMHGQGRAFDLDGLFWPNYSFVTLVDGYQARNKHMYFGVEALLRRHFGTVLDYNYNAAHRDHLHVDDGTGVGFRSSSRSQVLFIQAALNVIYAADLKVDGIYGPKTRAALEHSAGGDVTSPAVWLNWLLQTARHGITHV